MTTRSTLARVLVLAVCMSAIRVQALAQSVTPPGTRVELPPMSAEAANAMLAPPGTPPFLAGTQVTRLVTTAPMLVARTFVFNASGTAKGSLGSWMLPVAQLRGKSRAQYLDFWAMPIVPGSARNDSVAFVLLPAGTHVWSGVAGPIADQNGVWGNGGGAQYYVGPDANLPPGAFQTTVAMFFPTSKPLETLQAYGSRVSGSAAAVGRYLDGLNVAPFSDLDAVLTQLDVLPLIDSADSSLLTRAVGDLGPGRHAASALVSLRGTAFALDAFARRGVAAPGIGGNDTVGAQTGAVDVDAGHARIWFRGGTSFDRQVDRQDLSGFSSRTFSGLGGADVRIGRAWSLGLGGGVLGTPLTWDTDGGDANVTGGMLAAYAGYRPGRVFVDGAIAGGRNSIEAHRRLAIPGVPNLTNDLSRLADSRQRAWTFGTQVDVGVELAAGAFTAQPLLGLSYARFSQEAFDESGADSVNLAVDAYQHGDVRVRAGLRIGPASDRGQTRWRPEGQLVWTHAITDSASTISAGLFGQSGRFSLATPGETRDALAAGLGLAGRLGTATVHFRYDGDFSRDRRGHALSAAVGIAF